MEDHAIAPTCAVLTRSQPTSAPASTDASGVSPGGGATPSVTPERRKPVRATDTVTGAEQLPTSASEVLVRPWAPQNRSAQSCTSDASCKGCSTRAVTSSPLQGRGVDPLLLCQSGGVEREGARVRNLSACDGAAYGVAVEQHDGSTVDTAAQHLARLIIKGNLAVEEHLALGGVGARVGAR
eukprot:scaffold60418_cov56-Phaeocystis_antarctica.AAC.7